MLGWCNTGHHKTCPVKYQKWYHGKVRKGRKNVDAVIYLDEWVECDCKCHSPGIPGRKPVKKTTRRNK